MSVHHPVCDLKTSVFALMTLLLVSFAIEVAPPFVRGEGRLDANFTYTPLVPYANDTVTFDAFTSISDNGSIVSYEWSFGDITNGTGIVVNKVYEEAGNYAVTLTVTNSGGAKDTTLESITVIPRPEGLVIDLYNQKGGQGPNEPSGDFAPRDTVELTTLLTYYGSPVEYKLVGFEVRNALGEVVLIRSNVTDANGLATIKFTISGECLLGIFGTWTAVALADVAEQTVSDTLTFNVKGALLDVYTQKPEPYSGRGFDQPSDAFAPQEEVILYGEVHYSCQPVEYKLVAFEIIDANGTVVDVRIAMTDANGVATTTFRIPSDPPFGEWTVHATVDVAETTVNDSLTFKVGWIVEIVNLETVDGMMVAKTSFLRGEHVNFNLTWTNIGMIPRAVTYTIAVYDDLGVPIGQIIVNGFVVPPATTETFHLDLLIPAWAFIGVGTAHGSVLTGLPNAGGVPYAPEISTTFQISAP